LVKTRKLIPYHKKKFVKLKKNRYQQKIYLRDKSFTNGYMIS